MRTGWLLALTGCVLATACGGDGKDGQARDAAPAVTVTVGSVGHDHQLALYVAALHGERFRKDCGTYLKEIQPREVYDLYDDGKAVARIRHVKVGGGANMPAAMSRGEIEVGLGGVAAVAKFADKGEPFRILAPLQTDGDMLVMKADSPVNTWADFARRAREGDRPLVIGYKAPVAVAKLVFVGALQAERIPCSDKGAPPGGRGVTLKNLRTEKSPFPLLASGAIDGFVWNQPSVAVAVHKKIGKVVAHLCDLPPAGRWKDHPCCCVCTSDAVLAKHPQVLEALLKVLLLSTQLIRQDPDLAVDAASAWTKNERAVEMLSVPHIHYLAEPTDTWLRGLVTWHALMKESKAFSGKYADMSADDFVEDVLRLDPVRRAAKELRAKDLLKP